MEKVILLGTLDTKGLEYNYIIEVLEALKIKPVIVDTSCFDRWHGFYADYNCNKVAGLAGMDFEEIKNSDRKDATAWMLVGIKKIVRELYEDGVSGIMALGGANGSYMACEVMKTLPVGFPKVMISVVPAGDPRQNVGTDDIILFNTITDTYLNSIIKKVINNACTSLAGMIRYAGEIAGREAEDKNSVCISMLGLVQRCLDNIREDLERENWELLAFHTNGMGGRALEKVVKTRVVNGVIELAINEIVNNLTGGVFDAGNDRLEAAVNKKIPQVIVPGCIDFINFWGQNIPAKFKGRTFIYHSAQNTLMRTSEEENIILGKELARKLNKAEAGITVMIPTRGFSGNDIKGGRMGLKEGRKVPWFNGKANNAFVKSLKNNLNNKFIKIMEIDAHINDQEFSREIFREFIKLTGGVTNE